MTTLYFHRCRWPRGLRQRCAADRWLGLWVRILPAVCVSVAKALFSGWRLCSRLTSRPGEAYRVCINACDKVRQQPSTPAMSRQGTGQTNTKFILHFHSYTLFMNCCLIKRKGNWTLNRPNIIRITTEELYKMISMPSLFSESPYHTLCALDRRRRKNVRSYYYPRHVCPSASLWNTSAPTGRIFINFYKYLSRILKCH
jgi:hypothetical protein